MKTCICWPMVAKWHQVHENIHLGSKIYFSIGVKNFKRIGSFQYRAMFFLRSKNNSHAGSSQAQHSHLALVPFRNPRAYGAVFTKITFGPGVPRKAWNLLIDIGRSWCNEVEHFKTRLRINRLFNRCLAISNLDKVVCLLIYNGYILKLRNSLLTDM